MNENDLITKGECVKCKFLSNKFFQMLRIDYPFNLEIENYNKRNKTSLSFEEYILKDVDCLYRILWTRTDYAKHTAEDNVYTFIFHVRTDATKEDIQKAFDTDNSVLLNDRWINSNNWQWKEGDLTVEQFMANVRKAKALRAAKSRRKGQKIEKYDKDWKHICTYKDRQECLDVEGVSAAALSNHLAGRRKSLNGYYFVETK